MIIEWPLKWQFHDVGIDVLTSRTDVRGMNDDDDNDVQRLVDVLKHYKLLEWRFITFLYMKTVRNCDLTTYKLSTFKRQ